VGSMAKSVKFCRTSITHSKSHLDRRSSFCCSWHKGVLGPGNLATENQVPIMVTPTVMRIKYHYPYAIPALLTALVLFCITIAALIAVLFSHGSISRIRLHLQQISPGRIYTTFLYPEPGIMAMKSRQWARTAGKKIIDLSGEFPMAATIRRCIREERALLTTSCLVFIITQGSKRAF